MHVKRSELRLFFHRMILFLIPLGLLLGGVNGIVDPAELFLRRHFSRPIARALIQGNNVKVPYIPEEWGLLQFELVKLLCEKRSTTLDLTVWGTSRSSELTGDMFPRKPSFLNHVLHGGSVLDYVALYGHYMHYHKLPRAIIISVDPWSFCARTPLTIDGKTYWLPDPLTPLQVSTGLERPYNQGMALLGCSPRPQDFVPASNRLAIAWALFSPSYFQAAIRSLGMTGLEITKSTYSKQGFVIRTDGSHSLKQSSEVNPEEVAALALEYSSVARGRLLTKDVLLRPYLLLFEKLISRLKVDGARVILYISPLHATVYDAVSVHDGNSLEAYLMRVARSEGVSLIGSFDPHKYNLSAKRPFFLDYYHPTNPAVEIILEHHKNSLQGLGSH